MIQVHGAIRFSITTLQVLLDFTSDRIKCNRLGLQHNIVQCVEGGIAGLIAAYDFFSATLVKSCFLFNSSNVKRAENVGTNSMQPIMNVSVENQLSCLVGCIQEMLHLLYDFIFIDTFGTESKVDLVDISLKLQEQFTNCRTVEDSLLLSAEALLELDCNENLSCLRMFLLSKM